jgi:hypothetical protein
MDILTKDVSSSAETGPCIDFLFAYTDHDIPKMLTFCDPGGEVYFKPLGEAGRGEIGVLGKNMWSALTDAFPDLETMVHASKVEGHEVRCQVLIKGTQAKDFAGIESKGNSFGSDHIFVFRLNQAGKIDRIEIAWNHSDFARQLGQH